MSDSNTNESPREVTKDTKSAGVTRVYSEALLEKCLEMGKAEEVLGELKSLLKDVFIRHPEKEKLLVGDEISHEKKHDLIEKVFAGRVSDLVCNFLHVLNDHHRLALLEPIVELFNQKLDEKRGRVHVRVCTAVPLPEAQRSNLIAELQKMFQREPVLEESVDPDLLGGLVVRVGDWLYDASVKKQLEKINNEISESSSYEIKNGRDRFLA